MKSPRPQRTGGRAAGGPGRDRSGRRPGALSPRGSPTGSSTGQSYRPEPSTGVDRASVKYGDFLSLVKEGKVDSISYDASNGKITGQFVKAFTQDGHSEFSTQGQENQLPDADINTLNQHNVSRNYKPRST